jgi:membrane-associated phospholipid phosphatase
MHAPGVGLYKNSLGTGVQIRRNVIISSLVFLAAFVVARAPEAFDRPLTRLINSFANRSRLFDGLVNSLNDCCSFSGVVLMALIWSCWLDTKNIESRARILVGTLAAVVAGGVSRFLQHTLPTHPRPFHDPAFAFQAPSGLEQHYNTWNAFPSDHVTVFMGLAFVIYIARSRFAIFAIVWIIFVETSRVYMGGHYPSDLVGGAALGAVAVWATQVPWLISLGSRLVIRLERSSPSLVCMVAFFLSYQIATLFGDIRNTLGPLHIWSKSENGADAFSEVRDAGRDRCRSGFCSPLQSSHGDLQSE